VEVVLAETREETPDAGAKIRAVVGLPLVIMATSASLAPRRLVGNPHQQTSAAGLSDRVVGSTTRLFRAMSPVPAVAQRAQLSLYLVSSRARKLLSQQG